MKIKYYFVGTVTALTMLFVGANSQVASAAECTAANFTTSGVFDEEGYLACLGGLASTGSNPLDTIGLAAGILAVGGAVFIAGRRRVI